MDKLSNAIVLTSQGIALLHAGAEMLRTKQGVANSFNSPDSINQIDWSRKGKYKAVFDYYKGLIALRKNHPAFRMPSTQMIQSRLQFLDTTDSNIVAYRINGNANEDSWKNILVVFNGNTTAKKLRIPQGNWMVAVDGESIDEKGMRKVSGGEMPVAATSAYVLFEK